jgi:hypothetical protein
MYTLDTAVLRDWDPNTLCATVFEGGEVSRARREREREREEGVIGL